MSGLVLEFEKLAFGRKSKVRKRIESETAKIRKSFRESLAYGASGAVIAPLTRRVYSNIEFKGKLPKGGMFYRIGKSKLPTWIPATAAAGFIGAGVLPYLRSSVEAKRKERQLTKALVKTSQHISPVVFKAPHLRGGMRARIAEKSKSFASGLLKKRQKTGFLDPGEYRTTGQLG